MRIYVEWGDGNVSYYSYDDDGGYGELGPKLLSHHDDDGDGDYRGHHDDGRDNH